MYNGVKYYPVKMNLARKHRKYLYGADFMAYVLIFVFSNLFSCVRREIWKIILDRNKYLFYNILCMYV